MFGCAKSVILGLGLQAVMPVMGRFRLRGTKRKMQKNKNTAWKDGLWNETIGFKNVEVAELEKQWKLFWEKYKELFMTVFGADKFDVDNKDDQEWGRFNRKQKSWLQNKDWVNIDILAAIEKWAKLSPNKHEIKSTEQVGPGPHYFRHAATKRLQKMPHLTAYFLSLLPIIQSFLLPPNHFSYGI